MLSLDMARRNRRCVYPVLACAVLALRSSKASSARVMRPNETELSDRWRERAGQPWESPSLNQSDSTERPAVRSSDWSDASQFSFLIYREDNVINGQIAVRKCGNQRGWKRPETSFTNSLQSDFRQSRITRVRCEAQIGNSAVRQNMKRHLSCARNQIINTG